MQDPASVKGGTARWPARQLRVPRASQPAPADAGDPGHVHQGNVGGPTTRRRSFLVTSRQSPGPRHVRGAVRYPRAAVYLSRRPRMPYRLSALQLRTPRLFFDGYVACGIPVAVAAFSAVWFCVRLWALPKYRWLSACYWALMRCLSQCSSSFFKRLCIKFN